jgi:hypothetical protein
MKTFKRIFSFDELMASLPGRSKQLLVLTRHFFERLFQNEIFPFEEQMKEKVIVLLALLAVLGGHVSNSILMRYMFVPDDGRSWLEKCFFISFFMAVLAFATILEWDVIFLDKKDFANLRPLPVTLRTLLYSKFMSFLLFIALFSAAANALAVFVVAFYLPQWRTSSLFFVARYMVAHVISVLAANFFVFFFCVFLEALLMAFLSARVFRKLSLYVRFLLLAGLIFLMMVFVIDSLSVSKTFSALTAYKESRSPLVFAFPPMWFVGLYEVLLGTTDPLYSTLAYLAIASIAVMAVMYFVAMNISYSRHLKKTLEEMKRPLHMRKFRNAFSTALNSLTLRNSIQRAVFHFFGQTLRNSSMHKFHLAGYLAAAVGFILILLNSQQAAFRNMSVSNKNLLAIPLILSIALLVGVRGLVNVPLAPEANWIFRLTKGEIKRHYFIGLKKGITVFTILPLFGILFIFFAVLWGGVFSLMHCLFGLAAALWLMEILFWGYAKIPFACLTVPGKAKLHMLWWVYGAAILIFTSLLSRVEKNLFVDLSDFWPVIGAGFMIVLFLEVWQHLFIYGKVQIVYEEEPEPVLIGLDPRS